MPKITDPTPAVYQVRVETPLAGQYAQHICSTHGVNMLHEVRITGVQKIEQSEPEYGRGLVFWVRGTADIARKRVERIIAEAETTFNDRERANLAREDELDRERVLRDAEMGI